MEELTATAKPFIPKGSSPAKLKEISANAPSFVPKQLTTSSAVVSSGTEMSNSNQIPDKKAKKSGKKVKPNGAAKEKADPPTTIPSSGAIGKTKQSKLTVAPQTEQKKKGGGRRDKEKEKEREKEKKKEREISLREEEVRILTSRLKEKDLQLKQLEALQSEESKAQSAALAKKVEEEVTQKLFKASLLSDMYKNSIASSQQPSKTPSSRKDSTQPSSKAVKKSKNSAVPSGAVADAGPGAGAGDKRKDKGQSRVQGDRRDPAANSGGGGKAKAGGVLHLPDRAPQASPSGVGTASAPLSGGGRGKGTDGRGSGGAMARSGRMKARAYEMTPEEVQERDRMRAVKERAAALRRIDTLETETKDILGNIRKSKPLLQDFCLLGIRQGAPVEFVEKCSVLESHYSALLLQDARPSIIPQSISVTVGIGEETTKPLVKWAHKMCGLWGQQTGLIRQVIDKAEKKGGIDDSSLLQIRNVFLNELGHVVERLLLIVEPLEQILSEEFILARVPTVSTCNAEDEDMIVPPQSTLEKQLRSAIQVFFLAISDMGRLQLQYSGSAADKGQKDANLRTLKQAQVYEYRERALMVAPHDGAPYAALSKKALQSSSRGGAVSSDDGKKKQKGNSFLSAYYLSRGMGAEEPYLSARESLLDIFEDQKSVSDSLENVTALSRLTLSEHIQRYQVHFLAAVGVAFSRTGADRLSYHMTKARRHVGTMLQLVSTAQLSEQNRGGKGGFATFDQKAFQKGKADDDDGLRIDLDEKLIAQCREVDETLCRSLVIALALIDAVGESHGLHQVCAESQWAAAYANWIDKKSDVEDWTLEDHVGHMDVEERSVIEQRYVLQRLHRLKSIPGLLDILRLVVGLLASLLSTESIGNVLDAERREGKPGAFQKKTKKGKGGEITPRALATTRMLALFFEWLKTHPQYHAAVTVLDLVGGSGVGGGWDSVEAEVPQLISSLHALSLPTTNTPCITRDDVNLLGFVPLQASVAKSTEGLFQLERTAVHRVTDSSDATDAPMSFDNPQDYVRSKLFSFEQQTAAWVCHYASICCRTIRDLCDEEVRFGEMTFQVDAATGKRQAQLPSERPHSAKMTVVVYKTTSSASFSGFNNVLGRTAGLGSRQTNYLLSKEAFMSGAVVPEPQEEEQKEQENENTVVGGDYDEDEIDTDLHEVVENEVGDDDDDLDLNNLVLEDVMDTLDEITLQGQKQDHDAPPPGFHALPGVNVSSNDSQSLLPSSSPPSEEMDEDFAAMCAALLTVPLTATGANSDSVTDMPLQEGATSTTEFSLKGKDKDKEKGGGGLLRVNVPKALPLTSTDSKTTASTAKKTSKTRTYDGRTQKTTKSTATSGSNVYSSTSLTSSGEIPLIVVDAPNVAMRHGLNAKFSCKGIQLALNFFHSAGHKVIAFLPDYYLNFERVGELRRLASLNIGEVRASQLPDDIEILQLLVQQGFVIGTPSQDYDDSYCITYAQRRGGYIISNDMYRDHVQRIEGKEPREEARKWIKSHVISYTFVGDEFLPNPDASIFAR